MCVSKITPNISQLLFSLWYPLLTHYRLNIPGEAGVFPSHVRKSVPGWCRQADNRNKPHCCQPALWLEVLTRLTSSAPLRAGLSSPVSLAFFLTYEDPTHTHTRSLAIAALLTSCQQTSHCPSLQWHKWSVPSLWMMKEEEAVCSAGSWHLCLNVVFSFLHVKDRLSHML